MSNQTRRRIVIPRNRQSVTGEPDPGGKWTAFFPDMIGYEGQGGGRVPDSLFWYSSPKQRQEELTPETLKLRRLTPEGPQARLAAQKGRLSLPSGEKVALPAPSGQG